MYLCKQIFKKLIFPQSTLTVGNLQDCFFIAWFKLQEYTYWFFKYNRMIRKKFWLLLRE